MHFKIMNSIVAAIQLDSYAQGFGAKISGLSVSLDVIGPDRWIITSTSIQAKRDRFLVGFG